MHCHFAICLSLICSFLYSLASPSEHLIRNVIDKVDTVPESSSDLQSDRYGANSPRQGLENKEHNPDIEIADSQIAKDPSKCNAPLHLLCCTVKNFLDPSNGRFWGDTWLGCNLGKSIDLTLISVYIYS